jgi:hypothetical protein
MLLPVDPVASSYVLQNSDSFPKPDIFNFVFGDFTSRGTYNSFVPGLNRTKVDESFRSFMLGLFFVEGN